MVSSLVFLYSLVPRNIIKLNFLVLKSRKVLDTEEYIPLYSSVNPWIYVSIHSSVNWRMYGGPQWISKFHTATPIPSPHSSRTVPNRYSVFQIRHRLRLAPPLSTPGHTASTRGHLHQVMPPPPRASAPPHWLPSTLACTPSMPPDRFCYSGAGPRPRAGPPLWGISGAGPLALDAGAPTLDVGPSTSGFLFVKFFLNFVSNLRTVWMKIDYDRLILDKIWVR
jgi:hypothetical protein